jgi:renalase
MPNKHNKYAVIGAGISGASLAFHLQQYGHQVDIFDKGRALGGRLSTYQKDSQTFDYGSTLINTYPKSFLSTLNQWEKLNLIRPYQGIRMTKISSLF